MARDAAARFAARIGFSLSEVIKTVGNTGNMGNKQPNILRENDNSLEELFPRSKMPWGTVGTDATATADRDEFVPHVPHAEPEVGNRSDSGKMADFSRFIETVPTVPHVPHVKHNAASDWGLTADDRAAAWARLRHEAAEALPTEAELAAALAATLGQRVIDPLKANAYFAGEARRLLAFNHRDTDARRLFLGYWRAVKTPSRPPTSGSSL